MHPDWGLPGNADICHQGQEVSELDGRVPPTWTIGLHDGIRPRSSFSTIPRTAQLDSDPVTCGRFQIHQRDGLAVTVHWVKVCKETLSLLQVRPQFLFLWCSIGISEYKMCSEASKAIGKLRPRPNLALCLPPPPTFQTLQAFSRTLSFFGEVCEYQSYLKLVLLWQRPTLCLLTNDRGPRVGILGRHVEDLGRSNGPVTSMWVDRLH